MAGVGREGGLLCWIGWLGGWLARMGGLLAWVGWVGGLLRLIGWLGAGGIFITRWSIREILVVLHFYLLVIGGSVK